ncbi:MAG: nucleotidyltransferase family protein [Steroidobacteraceae bacterium]
MKERVRELARHHGARRVLLIGSVARGEERDDSDIDFLVELERGRSLIDVIGLENDLSDLFGRKVEVVPKQSAKPRVLAGSRKDAVDLSAVARGPAAAVRRKLTARGIRGADVVAAVRWARKRQGRSRTP